MQAERAHKHTQAPTPQPGVVGRSRNPSPSTHTHTAHATQELLVTSVARTQTHTNPITLARSGGVQPKLEPKHNPDPNISANGRKPSVHSPGTEAARAMQVTRPNEIRSPGVRLHPKACAALGLEAERATPKRLGTPVPRTCMHALGTGYARKSSDPLGLRSKEGTCASTGAHPPGETSTSRWRRSALPVLPGAALLGATSQVQRDVSRFPSSCAEPLPVRHRGDARGNHGAPPHDPVHLPTYLPLIAPTMSVRIFCHFLPFPIFLARRAQCSAPTCTPDAWTKKPHMVCSLCTLVPMTHTQRGRPLTRSYAKPSVDSFAILALVDTIPAIAM